VAGTDGVEDAHESLGVGPPQATQGVPVQGRHDGVEGAELAEAALRDEAENPAPVAGTALASDEALRLEAIEEAGDSRGLLDHSGGDVQGGEAFGPRAAQDPQDVVLLEREPFWLDGAGEASAHEVGGAEEAEDALLVEGRERPALADLALEGALPAHTRNVTGQ